MRGPFTLVNKKVEGFVTKKLDRIMVDDRWLELYSDIRAKFTSLDISDHFAG